MFGSYFLSVCAVQISRFSITASLAAANDCAAPGALGAAGA